MGTRAVYTFIDASQRHSVYKHWDGHPRGACGFIANAFVMAWPLPRFEADEFAAAFVAANKAQAGDIRLIPGPDAHGNLSFAYEIRCLDGRLHVRISRCSGEVRPLFDGTLEDALQFSATFN
jgi:hypothetical protein